MSESKQIFETNKKLISNQIHRLKEQGTQQKINKVIKNEKQNIKIIKGSSLTDLKTPKKISTINQNYIPNS